ncbi:MAG: glycosyl hydrolase family 28-related protein [Eubacteriales bacterium]|nr:glycosyl hydrolase family 28-related protein [Eubacteriales bacterium]
MKKLFALVIAFAFIFNTLVFAEDTTVEAWRSVLYPEDWAPGFTTGDGLFLQDYSYAGYHMGEEPVPTGDIGEIFNVTDPLYGADNTGAVDSTLAIQSAIDAAQLAGGGTIYLPEGTYKVSPIETGRVFTITHSNILIKGDGADKTKIYNTEPYMRMTTIFNFCPTGFVDWASLDEFNVAKVTKDLGELDKVIPVESVAEYKAGDWIFIKMDATKDFIAEHGQTNLWKTDIQPIQYYRQVIQVDEVNKTLTIDIPVRYTLKMRDNARVFRSNVAHLEEVGIKDMSFGMLENTKAGLAEEDYTTEGTAAYESHLSRLIGITHTVNGWITNIGTFKPAENTKDIHIISDGIDLRFCRSVTVDDCNIQKPLYEGGGGNGYLFNLKGQECLIINCYAYHGRHNYSFGGMYCSGNVLTASTSATAKKETDHHLHLAHANLIDSMIMKGDQLEAINRNSYGSTNRHGQTSTQVVFWNSKGDSYQSGESSLVETQQYGMGYVVGTKGAAYKVSAYEGDSTSPMDFVEGVGTGDTLVPQSLYLDQLERRIASGDKPNVIAKYPAQGKRLYEGSYVYFEFDRDMNAATINEQSLDIVPSAKIDVEYDAETKRAYVSFPDGMEAEREYAITLNAESILSQDDNSPMYNSTIRFTASDKA